MQWLQETDTDEGHTHTRQSNLNEVPSDCEGRDNQAKKKPGWKFDHYDGTLDAPRVFLTPLQKSESTSIIY